MEENCNLPEQQSFSLYVISGGVGASGEQLARTVSAQFQDARIEIELFPKVSTRKKVKQILQNAVEDDAIVAHSFVDPKLRRLVSETAVKLDLVAIDLVGPLMEALCEKSGLEPLGMPGLYRQLFRSYFDRISAMDYTLAHDDGKHSEGWGDAEIVLVGASRVGKTPVSLYLSVLGWRVANVPVVAGIKPRDELFKLDMRRVIGLTIATSELIEHREHRQKRLGLISRESEYVDPVKVFEETEAIEKLLKRHGISIIDVTGKPIETSADEVLRLVRRKLRI
ncbi:MAG: pyruvate, water dikinase regulatory protein [Acidobacteriota bacterium]